MFDKKLFALLGRDKRYVFALVFVNLCQTVANIIITFSICRIVNGLIGGELQMSAFVPALIGVLLRFGLSLLGGHFSSKLGSNAKEMLRRRIYDKVARLGVRETDDLSLAALTQVAVEGVEQLDLYYSSYLPQLFYSVLSPLILFILMMTFSPASAVVLLICVPLIPMSIIAVSRYAKKIFARYWGQYTKMGDAFLDNISGMKELKIFRADALYHDRMNGEAEAFRRITMKVLTMQLASTTIMDLVAYAGAGLGIAIATARHMHISPILGMSQPALLLFVVLIAVDFFLPLRTLGSAFHVSMNGATAGKKILTLLDTPELTWGEGAPESAEVKMEDVSFGYVPDRQILKGMSLEAAPGSMTAIVGLSGSGKSTILSILGGLRRADLGQVLIGGRPIESLSREAYYRCVGMVSYNTYLFNDTVRANFRLAKPEITDEEIWQRLAAVNLADVLRESGGLDLVLSEEAANLSGGQRQRLALAASLAADKEIWLFDEVTSNIDADSEAIILANILELAREKTVIMVSHRLKNFVHAGRIYVLDGGRAAEQGDHQSLMAAGGLYAKLFEHQQQLEEGYRR